MWIDERTRFANAVDITLAAGTNLIGDVVDTGDARDLGVDGPYLIIQVTTAFAGGTSCQFVLASDAQAALAADGNETRHYASDVFTDAQLTAGFSLSVKLPSGDTAQGEDTIGYERFLGMETITLGTHTAGAISAFLSPDPYGTGVVLYPDANN
jgi:hypothetical protein